jgi:hypothetical protein
MRPALSSAIQNLQICDWLAWKTTDEGDDELTRHEGRGARAILTLRLQLLDRTGWQYQLGQFGAFVSGLDCFSE